MKRYIPKASNNRWQLCLTAVFNREVKSKKASSNPTALSSQAASSNQIALSNLIALSESRLKALLSKAKSLIKVWKMRILSTSSWGRTVKRRSNLVEASIIMTSFFKTLKFESVPFHYLKMLPAWTSTSISSSLFPRRSNTSTNCLNLSLPKRKRIKKFKD